MAELNPNFTLSHYRIVSKLGAGGMGEVYLAEDTKLNRRVAIKLLPGSLMADEQARMRLVREAQAVAKLDHPNICSVYQVGEEDARTFIVMQYVEGETLDVRLKRHLLDVSESISIGTQVADALAEAHANGIIHRDIKPSNIMITPRGKVKVLDFGLAKILPSSVVVEPEVETALVLTQTGVVMGTAPYMSPEQLRAEPLDGRSDIFSYGSVLYELFSGRQPFQAKSVAELTSAILMRDPPPLQSQSRPLPLGLSTLISKCLEKEPSRRYQTMVQVSEALQLISTEWENGIRSQRTIEAPTVRMVSGAEKQRVNWRRFVKSPAAIVSFVVLLGLLALISYVRFSRRPYLSNKVTYQSSPGYEDYMRGRVKVSSVNRDDNEAAIKLLEQSVAADPTFAPALAELARAYYLKAFNFAPDSERKQLNEDAEVAVEKALALNADLAEAHIARGLILWSHAKRFPHEQAIQSYKRAIALNPNLDEAHHQLAVVYQHIGLLDEAWEEVDKALAINPGNVLARFRQGNINLYRAKYEEALAIYKSLPPEAYPAVQNRTRATALFGLGRTKDAESLVEESFKLYPADEGGQMTSVKAMLLAKAGKEREAEASIQRAIEIGEGFGHFHHTAYNIASAYALVNKPDDAVKWLEAAADDGFPCYPLFENDPNLNNIRKDERFVAFMAKLRKRWEYDQACCK